ncbi:MAG: cell division protein SepF [Lachnospiraceae bacterium]|nr:cell division protein SepF [Lachnospiraceae bacterium]
MGKMVNKILNIMRLDGYEDDDGYEDGEEYEEEIPVRKSVSKKVREEYYDEDDEEEEPERISKMRTRTNGKVVPIHSVGNKNRSMEVCVIKPHTVEDGKQISDTLLDGRAVVLNLEGLQVNIAQRIIDFASGACYSMNGNLQKISNYIFIITPEAVDISGDFQEILSSNKNTKEDTDGYSQGNYNIAFQAE